MQRAATVIRLALQKRWQGENLVKGGRTPTEPRSQWFCEECKCVDSQEHWLAHCKRGKLQELRRECLRRLQELGKQYPKPIRLGIQAITDYLVGGQDCGTLWTGVVLQHHMVKIRRFMNQSEISFEQQGAWEEAIVTVLAHTVHTAWMMLAEHERIITAAGGDTGHHSIRPGSPLRLQEDGTIQEATWMDKYLKRSNTHGQGSTRKRSRSKRDTSLTEPNRKPSQLHTREDTTPFCSKLVNRTQTLEEEQAYVRQHYGDDFSCAGDT